jgi:hypothetical protein
MKTVSLIQNHKFSNLSWFIIVTNFPIKSSHIKSVNFDEEIIHRFIPWMIYLSSKSDFFHADKHVACLRSWNWEDKTVRLQTYLVGPNRYRNHLSACSHQSKTTNNISFLSIFLNELAIHPGFSGNFSPFSRPKNTKHQNQRKWNTKFHNFIFG